MGPNRATASSRRRVGGSEARRRGPARRRRRMHRRLDASRSPSSSGQSTSLITKRCGVQVPGRPRAGSRPAHSPIAQSGRALDCYSRCPWFESRWGSGRPRAVSGTAGTMPCRGTGRPARLWTGILQVRILAGQRCTHGRGRPVRAREWSSGSVRSRAPVCHAGDSRVRIPSVPPRRQRPRSSVDRAPASGAGGRGFDPRRGHGGTRAPIV